MFVAWRDLRFAKGRFALVAVVVALVTVLVGFLSGLTGGLASQNVSGLLGLKADRVVLAPPTGGGATTFADSRLTPAQVTTWQQAPGVASAVPLDIGQGRASAGDVSTAVAFFAAPAGAEADGPRENGHVTVSADAAESLGVQAGGTLTVGKQTLQVDRVTDASWYSHTPIVRMTLDDRRATAPPTGDDGVTALLVSGDVSDDAAAAADSTAGTTSSTPLMSLKALPSFRSEIGSLGLIVALLFGISALIVGAFFTVWTMQRRGDVAVLAALGASRKALVRDALGQALVVLVIGVGVGLAIVVAAGLAAGQALPFILSPLTTLAPGLLMIALGLLGAAFAVRTVTTVDPLTALGSNR